MFIHGPSVVYGYLAEANWLWLIIEGHRFPSGRFRELSPLEVLAYEAD